MKLKFNPGWYSSNNEVVGEVVNGIDLSEIPSGTLIDPIPQQLKDAGILFVERDSNGELFVILEQRFLPYEYPVNSHDWRDSPWINGNDFDPTECYIIPMSVQDKTDYEMVFRDTVETLPSGVEIPRKGWTVRQLQTEEAEA